MKMGTEFNSVPITKWKAGTEFNSVPLTKWKAGTEFNFNSCRKIDKKVKLWQ